MMFCLEADLRPDAADPKKKSTDHMMPVADEGEDEKKEEKKENGTSALFTLHGIRIKQKNTHKKR